MRAEVYPSPDGWRFRVRAGNNEIMCTGEAYVRRIDAESALKQLFGNGRQSMEVVVRNHGTDIVDHYVLGRALLPGDEPVYSNDPPRIREQEEEATE